MQDPLSPEPGVVVPGDIGRPKEGEMMNQVWDMSRRVQSGTAGDQTGGGAT